MVDSSSLGLKIGIPPHLAQKLRENNPSATSQEEASSTPLVVSEATQLAGTRSIAAEANLPGISIQLQKLVGYSPEDEEERMSIRAQLVEAMWTSYRQTSSDGLAEETHLPELPPPDFDRQVTEFFESGVAEFYYRESDSENQDESQTPATSQLVISYPPLVQCPVTGRRIPTMSLMREIQKEPSLDFLAVLWKYLRGCSRSLFWKRDMAKELFRLVQEEQTRLEYEEWTETKRQSKLDNLYSIRETLVHQVDMANSKVEALVDERDRQVEEAMEPFRRRIVQKQAQDSMGAFGNTELSFPDEFQWLGLKDEPMEDEDNWGMGSDVGSDYRSDGGDEGSRGSIGDDGLAGMSSSSEQDVGDHPTPDLNGDGPRVMRSLSNEEAVSSDIHEMSASISTGDVVHGETPALSIPFQRRKERREKAQRRNKQSRKAAERKEREEHLRKIETELRQKLTSKELILAQTMHKALAEKMTQIEDLLDSLQDEVWQAEEEDEEGGDRACDNQQLPDDSSFSLLDQVLAMILGSTRIPDGVKAEDHYKVMRKQHNCIVESWKKHFGRLPPPATGYADTKPSSNEESDYKQISGLERRKQLGILENDEHDWEDLEDLHEHPVEKQFGTQTAEIKDEAATEKESSTKKDSAVTEGDSDVKPRLVGLRPGGRVANHV